MAPGGAVVVAATFILETTLPSSVSVHTLWDPNSAEPCSHSLRDFKQDRSSNSRSTFTLGKLLGVYHAHCLDLVHLQRQWCTARSDSTYSLLKECHRSMSEFASSMEPFGASKLSHVRSTMVRSVLL